jgi:hypothetical protein
MSLKKATLLLLVGAATVLLEQLEGTLLGLVALAGQILQSLLASGHFLATDNATVLVLNQILLGQTTGSMFSSAVEYLSLGANSYVKFSHLILLTAILFEGWCVPSKPDVSETRTDDSGS